MVMYIKTRNVDISKFIVVPETCFKSILKFERGKVNSQPFDSEIHFAK